AGEQRDTGRAGRRRGSGWRLRGCLRTRASSRTRRQNASAIPAAHFDPGDLSSRGLRVSPVAYRRPGAASGWFSTPMIALAAVIGIAVVVEALWGLGLLDLSRFRSTEPSTAGLVAVPTPARTIRAYTRVTRDHLWDTARNRLWVVYLPPRAVPREMLVGISAVIGRVLDHDKTPGYVFPEGDFLPKGTREGLVAGIPAGKRAIRIPADR